MSSTSTGVSTDQPQSSSSPSTDRPPSIRNSSNLYLITFLATLFLLLLISCTIVLRSIVLRRRFQRQVDEAFAAGIILAPRAQGSRRRRLGHKPKMHTSWVVQGGEKWVDMMPVSALPVQAKRRGKNYDSSSKHEHNSQPTSAPTDSFGWRLLHGIHPRDHINREPTPAHLDSEKNQTVRVDRLQVSVLIAMPSKTNSLNKAMFSLEKDSYDLDLEEEHIPNVVFGVTRLPYKHSNLT